MLKKLSDKAKFWRDSSKVGGIAADLVVKILAVAFDGACRQGVILAISLLETEISWRQSAAKSLLAGIVSYDNAIRGSIGLRLQERFNSAQAGEIASCRAVHRDISLSF